MTRFAAVDDARLHCRASREWGGISANRIHATAGRHAADTRPDHRLVFYETGGVAAECGCEGVRRVHTLTPGAFDLVPAGASGYWEDSAPVQFVSVRLDPRLLTDTAEALAIRGSIDLAPRIGARDAVIEPIVRAPPRMEAAAAADRGLRGGQPGRRSAAGADRCRSEPERPAPDRPLPTHHGPVRPPLCYGTAGGGPP